MSQQVSEADVRAPADAATTEPEGHVVEVDVGAPRPTTAIVTVVLVDDHVQLADIVTTILGGYELIEVVAVARTCADGLLEVARHLPDVCLLDQRLPDGLGTALVPGLHGVSPGTKVLLMTGGDTGGVRAEALRAGCVGVISKVGMRAAALQSAVIEAAADDTT